ncbi:inositol-tetrakisphosphate 1-kinase-like isoform X5 [Dicentrarchus labrax]|uniref:inositol-tetrakisphosphate 1-kinase-like isoform X5 n=1 Tax=Dicentrarchus labrax TaxID=13489 RepID=UPI0021F5684D|nr:inositol-tetrakisphosphate 1-kinase-like isoform X5 [Dicentrarchus labrax]
MNGEERGSGGDIPLSGCLCGHSAAAGPRTHSQMSGRRVGFCLSHKKRRRMNLDAFADFCAGHGVEVVEIDLTQPLVPQGPFDVIVHKLSDVIVEAEHDSQSQQLLANFQSYVSAHPSTVILDPLPAMTQLLDRFASYRIMSKLHNSLRDWRICSPPYLEINSASDLSSIQQAVMTQGLSFPLNRKTIFFNSHQVSKPESSSDLTALDEQMPCLPPPSSEAVAALVKELRVQLGMALFGVDVIINIHTHTLTVIDINIFPGYEGVPLFFSSLLSHIEYVLDKQTSAGPQATGSPESAQTTSGPSPATTGL